MPDFGEVFEGFSEQECDAATYDGARATAIWLKNYTKGFLRSDWDNEDLELPQCSFSLIPGAISGYNVTCTTKNAPYTLCDTIDPHQLPNHDHAPFAPETPPTNSLVDYHNAFLRESGWNISCEDQSHPDPTPHTAPFDEGSSANHTILSFTYPTSFPSTAEPAGARVLNNGPLEDNLCQAAASRKIPMYSFDINGTKS
ncbi:hypothetical protein DXG01_001759 [Tephrocybe rancida]|nr:hypothetical protein DXG01_001759 [Tephrocybe rancida]